MSNVLILFAHPRLQNSRTHSRLIQEAQNSHKVTVHDLYEAYPDFDIDVEHEQKIMLNHDIIILQHPFYWYSAPPILKQWIDLVLKHGWAYGHKGKTLTGKKIMNVLSTGGRQEAYQKDGFNKFTIREFLSPFEQTARLCNMIYLPPFVVHGTHLASNEEIESATQLYQILLKNLVEDKLPYDEIVTKNYMNEVLSDITPLK